VSRLAAVLREQYGHLGITGLREIGHGLDARVYRGSSVTLGDVALRVPHARYRLDTAVMLSHVFLDGAPDPGKARHYIDRVRSLCRLLG
jgi:hypothetical protein